MTSAVHDPGHDPGHDVAEQAERRWTVVVAVIVAILIAMMVFTGVHWAAIPPSRVETVDPTTLQRTGEFVEPNLGTTVGPDGRVTVRMVAQQYAFVPSCLVVPAEMAVTFRATATDAIHGFVVTGSNANTMLIPGFVSTFTTTFPTPGERLMPCHEYCGTGHEGMWGRVRVIPPAEFIARSRDGGRLHCDPR